MTKTLVVATIKAVIESPTSTGKWRAKVNTDQGEFTCWDTELAERFFESKGKTLELEINTNAQGYSSIVNAYATDQKSSRDVGVSTSSILDSATSRGNAIRAAVAFKEAVNWCIANKLPEEKIVVHSRVFYFILTELEKYGHMAPEQPKSIKTEEVKK